MYFKIKTIIIILLIFHLNLAINLEDLEMTERNEISAFQKEHGFVNYDDILSSVAEEEAQRLARLGKLAIPKINYSKKYVGYSKKIEQLYITSYNSSKIYIYLLKSY